VATWLPAAGGGTTNIAIAMTTQLARHAVSVLAVALLVTSVLAPAPSWAETDKPKPDLGETARRSADAGALVPWTMSARSDTQTAVVHLSGGYDAAKNGATFESVLEARIYGRLSFRAGGSYVGPDGEVRPIFAGKVDALRQEGQGVDLAVAGGYEPHGFNTVRAIAATVAVGRTFDDLRVQANVGAGIGLEEGERYGDTRLAALYRVGDRLRAGVDSRFRIDLERDTDEPEGEPDWELVAGPLATMTLGRFALTGGVGVSAIRLRLETNTEVGPITYAGLGTVF
jgi:hypothetical protein